jgi:hypothetical protein
VDAQGNIYAGGIFSGTVAFEGTTLSSAGGTDAFVAVLDASGQVLRAMSGGGAGNDGIQSLVTDGLGNIYASGYFYDTASFGGQVVSNAGTYNIFVAQYAGSSLVEWVKAVPVRNGIWYQSGILGIAADGTLGVTGSFRGTAAFDGQDFTCVGGWDVFLASMGPLNSPPTCDAGPDQVGECTGALTQVALDGTGSRDPDGDALTYTWSVSEGSGAPLDNPTSSRPTGHFPMGATLVSLSVTDGRGGEASDEVLVTVQDTTPPTITCPASITVPATGVGGAVVTFDVTAADNCPGVNLSSSPASGTLFPIGMTVVTSTATDAAGNVSTCGFTVTVTGQELSALAPAQVWIGLKNSDDVGTKFDLLAEVFKNGSPIGSGQLDSVPGGSSGFNNAVSRAINMALPVDVVLVAGDILSFRLSVRIAVNVTGHRSGTARLWFNDAAANSQFGVTVDGVDSPCYFLDGGILGTATGLGPKRTKDVFVDKALGGNPFKPFGIWTKTF